MKRRILIVALLMALLGALACYLLVFHEPREPVYEGKSLSYWLEHYYSSYGAAESNRLVHGQAETAVRHIGTNALPTLLRLLRAKDSPITAKFGQLLAKQRLVKIHIVAAAQKNLMAASGFEILGREARPSVPDLIRIFDANLSEFSRAETARALGSIGPDAKPAIPSLLNSLAQMNSLGQASWVAAPGNYSSVREAGVLYAVVLPEKEVLTALAQIHSEPELVVPVLIKCSADTNTMISVLAIRILGSFGPAARQAVPGLVKALQDPNPQISIEAGGALNRIDPDWAGVK